MTTVPTTASTHAIPRRDGLLRGALTVDGAFVALASLALAPFAAQASTATGIPASMLLATAAVMLPYGLYLLWSTRDPQHARAAGRVAVAADSVWIILTLLVLALGIWPLTSSGWWVLVIGAFGVADLGIATIFGLRRAQR